MNNNSDMFNKVFKLLVKGGHNEKSINKMMGDNFGIAVRSYPEAPARFIADVVMTLD